MHKSNLKIIISTVLLGTFSASAETLVGELAGEFSVNNLGAASYVVPLNVSPGTAGMEPKLAVNYSSRGDNGMLGVGFSLSGLSAITRSGASLDQDGFIDGVDFDDNDRFLLDGQRLEIVAINGTPTTDKAFYGDSDSEYRTEIDSFSRVIAYGQSGTGPAWFKVWTKSGLIYEYGNTDDSSFEPGTHTDVLSWSVNKITDTSGNYMTFTYTDTDPVTDPGPQISRIDYTGNEGVLLDTYNSVEFEYEDRPDPTLHFFMGAQMEQTTRLLKIVMKHNNAYLHHYRFKYSESEAGQSLLESVQQFFCADENTPELSLPKTWFGFSGTAAVDPFNCTDDTDLRSLALLDQPDQPIWTGDFNGDGLTDIFSIGQGTVATRRWIGLSNGDGTFDFTEGYGFLPEDLGYYSSQHTVLTGDFNGDGLTDICQVSAFNGTAADRWIGLSNGDGSFAFTRGDAFLTQDVKIYKKAAILTGDFNGDGLTDLCGLDSYWGTEEEFRWVGISNGDGTFTVTHGYECTAAKLQILG